MKQKDPGGTNAGRSFACMGKKEKAIGKEWCSRHPWSPVLRACEPWRVLRSCRRISQMAPLLLCQSHENSPCAACSHNWTFYWKQQFLLSHPQAKGTINIWNMGTSVSRRNRRLFVYNLKTDTQLLRCEQSCLILVNSVFLATSAIFLTLRPLCCSTDQSTSQDIQDYS